MSHLDSAYTAIARANFEVNDILTARSLFRQAAYSLRQARAFDLARIAEEELERAMGAPYSDALLDRIDRRVLGRAMKVVI